MASEGGGAEEQRRGCRRQHRYNQRRPWRRGGRLPKAAPLQSTPLLDFVGSAAEGSSATIKAADEWTKYRKGTRQ